MYVCMYVSVEEPSPTPRLMRRVRVLKCMYLCMHASVCVFMRLRGLLLACANFLHLHTCTHTHRNMYGYNDIYVYIYIYIYVYIHTYT